MSKHAGAPIRFNGCSVEVRDGKVDRALRQLAKKVQDSGKLQVLREKEYYEKPTQRRKREAAAARKRWEKKWNESHPTRPIHQKY